MWRSYRTRTILFILLGVIMWKLSSIYVLQRQGELYTQTTNKYCTSSERRVASRYKRLKSNFRNYFIALNLYNNEAILPDMASQLTNLISFLGRENVFVSAYENGSIDRTKHFLRELEATLGRMGVNNSIVADEAINPKARGYGRIHYLSGVRNRALEPLFREQTNFDKIIFLNDVLFCFDDVLELLLQADVQSAAMVCGLDYEGSVWPSFYDTWVSRDMNGSPFASNALGNILSHSESISRLKKGLPFQVFCCWNGGVILDARPFYVNNLRFRAAMLNECRESECSIICKDLWNLGYGNIVVVPRVKVAYKARMYRMMKRNYPQNIAFDPREDIPIQYSPRPSDVVCQGLD